MSQKRNSKWFLGVFKDVRQKGGGFDNVTWLQRSFSQQWRAPNRKCTYLHCRWARNEIPNDFGGFSRTPDSMKVVPTMSRDCRCPFPNMAAAKPEMYLSPVVGELETKFQMIFGGFQGRPTQRKWFRQRHVTAEVISPTWQPPNRKCTYVHL